MSRIHRGGISYGVPDDYWQYADWGTHALVHARAKRGEAITSAVLRECAAQAQREHDDFIRSIHESAAKQAPVERRHLAKADGFLQSALPLRADGPIRERLRESLAQWFASIERDALGGEPIR